MTSISPAQDNDYYDAQQPLQQQPHPSDIDDAIRDALRKDMLKIEEDDIVNMSIRRYTDDMSRHRERADRLTVIINKATSLLEQHERAHAAAQQAIALLVGEGTDDDKSAGTSTETPSETE